MALVLLRLRLAIARRSRGHGSGAQLYFAASWVIGGVGGLLAGLGSAVLVSGDGAGDLLLLVSFFSIFLPWVIGPIVEPTLADGVVDPQRLEQFPLTGRQQVGGLLLGALASPTATFTFLFAAGGVVAVGASWPARLASLVLALAFTVMCVTVSRSAQALLAGAMRSRRGTDIAAFAASLLVLAVYLFAQQAHSATEALGTQPVDGPIGTLLGWTPPGAAARAILSARDGDWLDALARLGVVAAVTALAVLAWAWVLGERVNGTTGTPHDLRRRRGPVTLPLTPAILRGLRPGPTTAAASQQLRYFFLRSPRAIQTLVIPPVMGIVVAHTSFAVYGLPAQAAAFAAMSVVAGSFNLFGYDGRGFTYLVLGGAPLHRVLRGKALAPLVYLLPLVVGFSIVEGSLQGQDGAAQLTAILAGTCVVVLGLGVGAASSVLNPSDQSRVGQRRGSFFKVFGWFMGFFAVAGVGGGVWWAMQGFAGPVPTGVIMLLVAVAAGRGALGWSGRRLDRDPYEVMRKLDPRTV
ncbi:MAG: hypothetical protein QM779_02610 [Propionicimonas sp.]|uniref:hypothetical protein n=1 Tax=Propionicimonas sp. TaxID=1955623 RepID=UPI003D133981